MNTRENANAPAHYLILTVAIIIGIVGVFLRFLGDSFAINAISNIILVIGVIIALRTVFAIMK
ncbi:hypothetical protein [Mucilaginibacter paludis]|uniref:Uncharacterized protein n=1 Tax=Mucilaginibacter paludis DSM 18603 TaxID=714943 RepID=H1Y0A1_9SPHI|nr:hypothetical protein [Mucilaginibacter paludis]EHQ28150.1 hypothetical protein Mucpa_4059 [Mucilaginibacter paludis DSM 18603]